VTIVRVIAFSGHPKSRQCGRYLFEISSLPGQHLVAKSILRRCVRAEELLLHVAVLHPTCHSVDLPLPEGPTMMTPMRCSHARCSCSMRSTCSKAQQQQERDHIFHDGMLSHKKN
jgi:hypothetical protein